MRVDVYNKYHASSITPCRGTAVISIGGPNEPYCLMAGWNENVLRVEFDDVIKTQPYCIAFCDAHAEKIHAFIERHKEKDFMIHCSAGMSRSVAVGVFMREHWDAELHLHEPLASAEHCNGRVLAGLRRKYWNSHFNSEGRSNTSTSTPRKESSK